VSRWQFRVEYDGTDFCGWQTQAGQRTVQGVLEEILSRLMCREVSCAGAGRTDAGVHSRGQVAHLDLEDESERDRLLQGFPRMLPPDISVGCFEETTERFHARFSALSRTYSYRLSSVEHALESRFVHVIPSLELDIEPMEEACILSLGSADWRALAKEGSGNSSWEVHVMSCGVEAFGEHCSWTFRITANRFLRGMVRLWVGTLVEIGRGRLTPPDLADMIRNGDRSSRGQSMPARGLCLERVAYPDSECR
jgi:tRNA pseudouridine38-40 synthase